MKGSYLNGDLGPVFTVVYHLTLGHHDQIFLPVEGLVYILHTHGKGPFLPPLLQYLTQILKVLILILKLWQNFLL